VHTFLNDDIANRQSFLPDRHLVTLFTVQILHLTRIGHRHDAHAIGTRIRLDDNERLFLDTVLLVFPADFRQDRMDTRGKTFFPFMFAEIDMAALGKERIEQPGIDPQHFGEPFGNIVVCGEMIALAAYCPAGMQWREQTLLINVLQYFRCSRRKIVIQENRTRIEIIDPDTAAVIDPF